MNKSRLAAVLAMLLTTPPISALDSPVAFSTGSPSTVNSETIEVGDIEINPADFSAELDPEKRVAKCLSCHGSRGGGDIDFGPDAHFGTPALRGMSEDYLRNSLIAYKTGTRIQQEMSVIAETRQR